MGTCCPNDSEPEHTKLTKSRPQPKFSLANSKSHQETHELQSDLSHIDNPISLSETEQKQADASSYDPPASNSSSSISLIDGLDAEGYYGTNRLIKYKSSVKWNVTEMQALEQEMLREMAKLMHHHKWQPYAQKLIQILCYRYNLEYCEEMTSNIIHWAICTNEMNDDVEKIGESEIAQLLKILNIDSKTDINSETNNLMKVERTNNDCPFEICQHVVYGFIRQMQTEFDFSMPLDIMNLCYSFYHEYLMVLKDPSQASVAKILLATYHVPTNLNDEWKWMAMKHFCDDISDRYKNIAIWTTHDLIVSLIYHMIFRQRNLNYYDDNIWKYVEYVRRYFANVRYDGQMFYKKELSS